MENQEELQAFLNKSYGDRHFTLLDLSQNTRSLVVPADPEKINGKEVCRVQAAEDLPRNTFRIKCSSMASHTSKFNTEFWFEKEVNGEFKHISQVPALNLRTLTYTLKGGEEAHLLGSDSYPKGLLGKYRLCNNLTHIGGESETEISPATTHCSAPVEVTELGKHTISSNLKVYLRLCIIQLTVPLVCTIIALFIKAILSDKCKSTCCQ